MNQFASRKYPLGGGNTIVFMREVWKDVDSYVMVISSPESFQVLETRQIYTVEDFIIEVRDSINGLVPLPVHPSVRDLFLHDYSGLVKRMCESYPATMGDILDEFVSNSLKEIVETNRFDRRITRVCGDGSLELIKTSVSAALALLHLHLH